VVVKKDAYTVMLRHVDAINSYRSFGAALDAIFSE